jgi:hypothetical protein
MMKAAVRGLTLATLMVGVLLTTGCANRPQALYQWGNYQGQVYEHFKTQGQAPEAQIQVLEADLQKIAASGAKAPPGYHAHLGMLYSFAGRSDQAVQSLMKERALFPESAAYVDFLLTKLKK